MALKSKLYLLYFKFSYFGPHFCTDAYMGYIGRMTLNPTWEVMYLSNPLPKPLSQNRVPEKIGLDNFDPLLDTN